MKRVFSIILVLAVFVGSFAGSRYLFDQGTYGFDNEDIAIFDDDPSCYYLQKADKDIIFRVVCDEAALFGYTLADEQGTAIQTKTQKAANNCYDILPPSNGYEEGAKYTLSLPDGVTFESEDLKNARALVFSIDKETIERYEFTDAVVQVDSAIGKVVDDKLDIKNFAVNVGEILFGQDENKEYVAYKVTDISADGMATVSYPAIDEIYSDLEIYGEYSLSAKDIVSNPELEAEIIENFKQSSFFNALTQAAYADYEAPKDGKTELKIKPNYDNNSIELEFKTVFEPGEKGLFGICTLKNQKVTITLFAEIALSTRCNIQGLTNWDISVHSKTAFSWKFDISLLYKERKEEDELSNLFSKDDKFANLIDYHNNVKKLTEKLNDFAAEVNAGEIKLFNWKIPVPSVPGLYFNAEIKLFSKMEMALDMTIGQTYEIAYTVGVNFINYEFKTYSNSSYNDASNLNVYIRGKAKIKTGIKLVIKATFIDDNIMHVKLEPQVGYYMDAFLTYPISGFDKIDKEIMSHIYIEHGLYFGAEITARIKHIFGIWEDSWQILEEKFLLWKSGNEKIAIGLKSSLETVYAIDNTASAPEILFDYFDVKDGIYTSEKLPLNNIRFFTNDGAELKVIDGKIQLPNVNVLSEIPVTAKYMHTNGQEYSAVFKVSTSGAYKAYLDILMNKRSDINDYYWQKDWLKGEITTPVVFADICGDSAPELIYVQVSVESDYARQCESVLNIVTLRDGQVVTVYSAPWDYNYSSGYNYFLFQINESRNLFLYVLANSPEDGGNNYMMLVEDGEGNLSRQDILTFSWEKVYVDEAYASPNYIYKSGEESITEDEYKKAVSELLNSTKEILMHSSPEQMSRGICGERKFLQSFVDKNGCKAMTCDEAIKYLQEKLGIKDEFKPEVKTEFETEIKPEVETAVTSDYANYAGVYKWHAGGHSDMQAEMSLAISDATMLKGEISFYRLFGCNIEIRDGILSSDGSWDFNGTAVFNDDGSITLNVADVPNFYFDYSLSKFLGTTQFTFYRN